jgi:DNA polymerase-3 subunit delta
VKANKAQLDKALKNPSATRLFLLHGPDEAGNQALARRVGAALGPEAERIALSGGELKNDPARLADEAAALSMFGSGRWVVVSPAGDEVTEAAAALLSAPAAGNPVVLIAGALKPTSKLLKVRQDVAQRLAEAAGANRAVIEQELDKFALYLDAAPGRSVAVDHDVVAAVGAALDEGDASQLIEHLFSGNGRAAEAELARLRSEGTEGIVLLRAALRRALLLARLRAAVDAGERPDAVMARQGKALFWKEKDGVERQLGTWHSATLARCLSRLVAAEREVKRSGGVGPVAAEAELLALARQGARRA